MRTWLAAVLVGVTLTSLGVTLPASAAPVAPQPVVSGNVLLDAVTGQIWQPRGVNFPSFEYACAQGWGYSRSQANATTAAAIAAWHANVVRVPLNQDCWNGTNGAPSGTGRTAAGYRDAVATFVSTLNAAGLAVIIDLHSWKSPTSPSGVGQRAMPDAASLTFWASVASRFAGNPSVIFDAFNEPYTRWGVFSLTWTCWKNGGCQPPIEDDYTETISGVTYTAVGMDAIVATIRAAGAQQPILLAGLDYSNDLRQWLSWAPDDDQLIAGIHAYQGQRCNSATCWNTEIGAVAAEVPVIAGEFASNDSGGYMETFMTWADARSIGYLPWAWWVLDGTPGEYALLSNDNGTPRAPLGTTFKAHLDALAVVVPDPCPPRLGPAVPQVSAWVPPGLVCPSEGGDAVSLAGLSGTAVGWLE